MIGITKRQRELLQFLSPHLAAHGGRPGYREIARAMNWSGPGYAYNAVRALLARGYVRHRLDGIRIELVETIGEHRSNCFCDWCNAVRVRTTQTFIQALHVPSKILAGTNFKALGHFDRVCWLTGFPKPAHPETRKPKAKMQPAKIGIA